MALGIPREFELDALQVEIRREGNSLVTTPLRPDCLLVHIPVLSLDAHYADIRYVLALENWLQPSPA